VDGSRRSDEALKESGRRRLLYIHEEMKICCDGPILTKDIPKCFGRKSGEGVKVKI